jgi:hypothetical protein
LAGFWLERLCCGVDPVAERAAAALPLAGGGFAPLAIRVLILDPESEAAARRAAEIGEAPAAFAVSIRLAEHKLAELAQAEGIVMEAYRYAILPTWRIIALDDTMFVSTFDTDWEGHESPVYRIDVAGGGALYRGFRRMLAEMTATAERFI